MFKFNLNNKIESKAYSIPYRIRIKMSKSLEPNCPLCIETLTIKNAVNPACGHTHCSTCFWKWARKSNACPFCRKDLIARERQKELELANMLERRHEIREHLEEMFNEGYAREEFLRILQDDINLEEMHLKDLKMIMKENFKILEKVEKWEARINLWESCPDKAIELWKEEAKEMKKNWRVSQIKKLRVCLNELDIIVRLNDQPYKYENRIYTHKYHIPCLKWLINRVHHLVRAEKVQRPLAEPITEEFNLDTLFLEPEDLEETEQLLVHSPSNIESVFLAQLEQFQNSPLHIVVGPSSTIHPRDSDNESGAAYNEVFSSPAAPFHYTTVWTMTDIFENHRRRNVIPDIN